MKYPYTESTTLEFKREIPGNDQIIKTVIGFCNQSGGKLIIGIANDGKIVGLIEKEIESTIESLERSIYDACFPPIIPRISTQRFEDAIVIVIEVSEGMSKPYYRLSEGKEKGTYIRLAKHTARATAEIIQELEWQALGLEFESMPVRLAQRDNLNLNEIKNFLTHRKNGGKAELDEEIFKAYNINSYEHNRSYPSVLGILLFGKNPQQYFSEAMIICSHFQGVTGRETIATVDCEGTLFHQFKQAHAFILDRLYRSFTIKNLLREEQLEIPEIAIREALLNMIIHRNYHIKAPSKIAIYDDRIEFYSPGQFPGPLDTNNLMQGISYLRNPMMCKVLREANYIEKLGSGFISIFDSYSKAQLKKPLIIEGDNYVKCILPREKIEKFEIENSHVEKIKNLLLINKVITISDVMKQLSLSRSTALRRLNEMIELGMIMRDGSTRAVKYRLRDDF